MNPFVLLSYVAVGFVSGVATVIAIVQWMVAHPSDTLIFGGGYSWAFWRMFGGRKKAE